MPTPGFHDNEPSEIEVTANDGVEIGEQASAEPGVETVPCAQCQTLITADQAVQTGNAVFCRRCFAELKAVLEDSVAAQSQNINFVGAIAGGAGGALLGAILWWGFVTVTNIQFGLVAVVIGWAAGKGVVIFSGNKRALSLQAISVGLAAVGYAMASYWVTMSAYHSYAAANGIANRLPMMPSPELLIDVVGAGFQMFDLIFVAIALWQAWKMPAPVVLNNGE